MDPELSRRAYRITRTDAYTNMRQEDRLGFIREVERVKSYEELPETYKDIIKAGEREMQGY
jgi:hypothetical protein